MVRKSRLLGAAAVAACCAVLAGASAAAAPDLSGRWLPVPERGTAWPEPLPLTDAARERFARFEPDRHEPADFCMPLGTPRNTLSGTSAVEVLQTADRVYFVFQPDLLNVETRRVYLDGRPVPPAAERVPSWFGISRGRWDGDALVVETIGLEAQAILDGSGLSHSGELVVRERWTVERDRELGRVLVDELVLEDAATFTQPVTLKRVFAWAPHAQLSEPRCSERLWIDQLWRQRLAEHAAAARERKADAKPPAPRNAAEERR